MRASTFLCNFIGFSTAIYLLAGCSAGQPIRVIDRGQTQLTASVGGPVVPSTSPVKLFPYVSAGIMHGVTDEVTVHANLHLIMLAFGSFGVDVGASSRMLKQDKAVPELTVGLRALMFTDFSSIANTRLYPDASLTASWEVDPRLLVYVGSHVTMQFSDASLFVSPMIGTQIPIADRLTVQLEIIWQAANANTQSGVFRGESSINGRGSIGIFIGMGFTF